MTTSDETSVSALLNALAAGRREAAGPLFEQVYAELKGLAAVVRKGRAGETLNTSALVHEAYLRLVNARSTAWANRSHFLAVAARAMRQILIDAARRELAAKRGGTDGMLATLDESVGSSPARPAELMALDAALTRLADVDARKARIVEQRFFGGLTVSEIAEALGISVSTVEREWRAARAWLALELSES
jgi:RNA polymerase sigma factor (TIGR02999 family)